MTAPGRRHRLEGLEPDNLLAFLALLGLLRAIATAQPSWRPRAAWDFDNPPLRPLLVLPEPQAEMAICETASEGAALLAEDYSFPQNIEGDTDRQNDLNYDSKTARKIIERVVSDPNRRRADLWSALISDAAEKDGKIEATPLCLLFGQGHQHFLDRLADVPKLIAPPPRGRGQKAVKLTAAETLHETLFQPWTRQDPTPAFRWDPAEDVRYALLADDPSGDRSLTQHGANRLASLGLPVLTATPARRGERVRLEMVGGRFQRTEFAYSWPIWRQPASLAAIRALLTHPDLAEQPWALAHLGVVEVRQARRINVGKFLNITRADPIVSVP